MALTCAYVPAFILSFISQWPFLSPRNEKLGCIRGIKGLGEQQVLLPGRCLLLSAPCQGPASSVSSQAGSFLVNPLPEDLSITRDSDPDGMRQIIRGTGNPVSPPSPALQGS